MRIIITAIAMSLCVATHAQVENVTIWRHGVGWWVTSNDTSFTYKNHYQYGIGLSKDGIRIYFDINLNYDSWAIVIGNTTDSTITVKWSKSQIDGAKIAVGETPYVRIKDNTENDDYVYAKEGITRFFTTDKIKNFLSCRTLNPVEYERVFEKTKKPQQGKTDVTLCMEVGGQEKIYRFTLHAIYNGKR